MSCLFRLCRGIIDFFYELFTNDDAEDDKDENHFPDMFGDQ